jgi:hypothetical protein
MAWLGLLAGYLPVRASRRRKALVRNAAFSIMANFRVTTKPAAEYDPGRVWNNARSPSPEEHARESLTFSASLHGTAEEGLAMEVLYSRCCGMAVHKSSVSTARH